MKYLYRKIRFVIFCFFSIQIYAQDTVYVVRDIIQDEENPFAESLKKGKMLLGIGANIFTDNTRNQDQFTSYIIEEKDRNFNLKLVYGYFIKDTHPIGVGFKYTTNNLNSTYENLLADTVVYHETNNDFIINIFYGVTKALYGSKRIYFISDPSLFITTGTTKSERTIDDITDFSKGTKFEVAVG